MPSTNHTEKPKRQNAVFKHLRTLHWLMAAAIFFLYATGIFVANSIHVLDLEWLVPLFHQSLGILFLMMLTARVFLLLRFIRHQRSSRSPRVTSYWLRITVLNSILYFFMLITPVSGFLMRNFAGLSTSFLGIPIPSVVDTNQDWAETARMTHFWLSYFFRCLSCYIF